MLSTRYVIAVGVGSELIMDGPKFAPRDILALECFAKLAKATAKLGKIEAHLDSIFDASTSSLIAVPKQSSGVSVREDKIGNMVLLERLSGGYDMFRY
jgi:hypothetical protein